MILFYTVWLTSLCILHFPKYPFYFPRKKAIQSEEIERERKKSRTQREGEGQASTIQERKERNLQGHEREREREREREVATSLTCLLFLLFPWSPLLLPEGLVCWEDSAGGEGAPSTFKDMYWEFTSVICLLALRGSVMCWGEWGPGEQDLFTMLLDIPRPGPWRSSVMLCLKDLPNEYTELSWDCSYLLQLNCHFYKQ